MTASKAPWPDAIPMPSIRAAEKKLGLKTKEWEGQCYGIACLFVEKKLVPGVAVYGHWLGPVHKDSLFFRGGRLSFQRHGWVQLPTGDIFDPTRWAFEMVKPYLFCGKNKGLYDEGGNQVRSALRGREVPPFNPKAQQFFVGPRVMDSETWTFVEHFLELDYDEQEVGALTWEQLCWLANTPPSELGKHTHGVYNALKKLNQTALIPIDNLCMVERDRP